MKRRTDPRHRRRRAAIKVLFAWSFQKGKTRNVTASLVLDNADKIDQIICRHAPEWPIEKIGKIDLAILRLAIWELIFASTAPPKVIIDEAVELAKEFGGESTPAFVNGVLGAALSERKKDESGK